MLPPGWVMPLGVPFCLQAHLYLSLVPERFPNPAHRGAHRPFTGTLWGLPSPDDDDVWSLPTPIGGPPEKHRSSGATGEIMRHG